MDDDLEQPDIVEPIDQLPLRRIGGDKPALMPEPAAEEAPVYQDELEQIQHSFALPADAPIRVVAARLRAVEQHLPDALKVGQALLNLEHRIRQLEPVVQHLSQQRAVAEISLERHTRNVALDLAIKACPEGSRDKPEVITGLAEGFLAWLRAGTQG